MATYHIDLVNGDDANDGSTWALAKKYPILTGTSSDPTINKFAKTPVTSLGQNAQWTNLSQDIVLTTALTTQIEDAIGNTWTLSANVTGAADTSRKLGASCQRLNLLAGFTTGKIAYKTLPGTLDLSAFQNISFWARISNITYGNNRQFRICLCSDASGDTIVDSLPFTLFNYSTIQPFLLENGAALGSSINSIALYCDVSTGLAVTIYLNHIFACNNLHLLSLIGKGSAQRTEFFEIQSIVGTTIKIDSGEFISTASRGYWGTTESVETFIRQCYIAPNSTTAFIYISTISRYVDFLGGFNTITDEQDGETWIERNNINVGIFSIGANLCNHSIENFGLTRCSTAITITFFKNIKNIQSTSGTIQIKTQIGTDGIIDGIISNNNTSNVQLWQGIMSNISNITVNSHIISSHALIISVNNCNIENIECNNHNYFGPVLSAPADGTPQGMSNYIKNMTAKNSVYLNLRVLSYDNVFENLDVPELMFINARTIIRNSNAVPADSGSAYYDLFEFNRDKVVGAYRQYYSKTEYLEWQTAIKHGTEPGAWKSVGNTSNFQSMLYAWKIAEIAVEEGVQITVRAWIYGPNAGAPNIAAGQLMIRTFKSPAIDSDYIEYVDRDNKWHEVGITLVPDRSGVITLEFSNIHTFYIGSISMT